MALFRSGVRLFGRKADNRTNPPVESYKFFNSILNSVYCRCGSVIENMALD